MRLYKKLIREPKLFVHLSLAPENADTTSAELRSLLADEGTVSWHYFCLCVVQLLVSAS